MPYWAAAPQKRDQMVLFSERLDEVVPLDHPVRLLDTILGQLDWSQFEACYHGSLGQPAIHPRVVSGVLLYGLLTRIRSSRSLEDALRVRLDFLWLAEGRTIDHTTLSEFRRNHGSALKDVFVQVCVVARDLGFLSLTQLAFDGTRLRANNRRSGTRTPAELKKMRQELADKFAELEAKMAAEDIREDESFVTLESDSDAALLADVKRRQEQVAAALAELERVQKEGETTPKRIPLTDPQSRLTPNKEGGFAPNYTPLATVDVASGMVVSADVIAMLDEEQHLLPAIDDVQEQFGLEEPPAEVLADGLMATGSNLAALKDKGVTLYSPVSVIDPATNPAQRDDLTQPVPPDQWDRLPTKKVKFNGQKGKQLDKAAFIYDEERDCYWCPAGKPLEYKGTSQETTGHRHRIRRRYSADSKNCADCPLRDLCVHGKTKQRQVNREQHEEVREEHAERMATDEAKQKYSVRRHVGERPFAVIKHHFGARRFLLRGLDQVRTEWLWLASAFNLKRLMNLIQSRAGPAQSATVS